MKMIWISKNFSISKEEEKKLRIKKGIKRNKKNW